MTARSAIALARTAEWAMASMPLTMRRAPSTRLATSVSRPAMKSWRARSAGRTARDRTRTPGVCATSQTCRFLSGAVLNARDVCGTGGALFCQVVFQGGLLECQVVARQRVLLIQDLLGTSQLDTNVGRFVHDDTSRACHVQYVLPCPACTDDSCHVSASPFLMIV